MTLVVPLMGTCLVDNTVTTAGTYCKHKKIIEVWNTEEGVSCPNTPCSKKAGQWVSFSSEVFTHIEEYVIPQYGDFGNDQATGFTSKDIKENLQRYVSRIGVNKRGKVEAIRDAIKIAHYACLLKDKLEQEL